MGMTIPEEYGGGGTDTLSYAIAIEELTRIDSSVAVTVAAHHSLGTLPIYLFGTEEQRRQWLPDLASGRRLAAFGLTEPEAGSDASALRTTAALVDGRVVDRRLEDVHHQRRHRDHGVRHDHRPHGRGRGLLPDRPERHAGLRDLAAARRSSAGVPRTPASCPSRARACRPATCSASAGPGLRQFLRILDGGRISIAAMGVGLAQGCYDLAAEYAQGATPVRPADRVVPGRPAEAGRHGDRDRGGATARLQGGVGEGRGPRLQPHRGDGEALLGRALAPGRELGASRSTAGTASWTSTRSRVSTATRRSSRSARGRTRCSGW